MVAVFAGTWHIVKRGSADKNAEEISPPAPAVTAAVPSHPVEATSPTPAPLPVVEQPQPATPAPVVVVPPAPVEQAVSEPASVPPAMREPLTPLEPTPPPMETAAATEAPAAPPAEDAPMTAAAPVPATPEADKQPESTHVTPPAAEAEEKTNNALATAAPAVMAKLDDKQAPPAQPSEEAAPAKDKEKEEANSQKMAEAAKESPAPAADKTPAEEKKESPETDKKAEEAKPGEMASKENQEGKPETASTEDKKAEDAKTADAGKEADKDKTKGKEDAKAKDAKVADKNAKPEIKDATNSKAADHDMEGPPEDGHGDAIADIGDTKKPAGPPQSTKNIKPTTSNEMPGWELLNYQSRDYITAHSIHRFYRFSNLSVEGNNVWFRSPVLIMKATIGSQDLLINNIKFVMSYPVVSLNDKPCFSRLDLCKLIDPVLRPSYIGSAAPFDTVIIDPGHGGHDSGAKGIYGYEKDFALKLAFSLKTSLERKGLKVVMTRSTDTFLSLGSRVAIANKVPNSIYVSLHFNSGGSAATGIETFALSPQGSASVYGAREVDYVAFSGNQRDSENIALATAIHAGVVHHFKLVDRGVKRARWHVLKGLQRPGILFEGGFVTNANDGRLIAAENFRTELAGTIAQSIMNYRRALQPKSR